MKNLFFCICLFYVSPLLAQIQEIVKNPKNAWVTTFTTDVRVDLFSDRKNDGHFTGGLAGYEEGLSILKILETKSHLVNNVDTYMSQTIFRLEPETSIYSDSLCSKKADFKNVYNWEDTIVMIDPITYQKKKVVTSCKRGTEFTLFRVFHVASYQPESGQWVIKVLSVAPLREVSDAEGNFMYYLPVFWMKVEDKRCDFNLSDITWAVRTNPSNPKDFLDLKTASKFKTAKDFMPINHFIDFLKTHDEVPIYEYYHVKMDSVKRERVFETTSEKNYQMKIIHEWAWDDKKKQLSINVLGFAPLVDILNNQGQVSYKREFFYYRFNE